MKDYFPILVFYIKSQNSLSDAQRENIKLFAELKRYEVLIWAGVQNERVEIISVDSSVIVEDLQSYIDNIVKELKNS